MTQISLGLTFIRPNSVLNLMPCWMTQISLGLTFIRPNSVLISRVPCWGTMRKSPSLLYMALLDMDLLQVNTCTAIPCLVLLSPAPATVLSPSTQSTCSEPGRSKGFHLIWFGLGGWSVHWVVRNLWLYGRKGWCFTEGRIL